MDIFYIWMICALFNILKLNQSYSTEWIKENFGIYLLAIVLAPIITIISFIVNFIFNKWN